jgi:hypothetical protein
VVLPVWANYKVRICPGLEAGLASIGSLAENKETVFGNWRACVVAANHWKHHELSNFKVSSVFPNRFYKEKKREKRESIIIRRRGGPGKEERNK